MIKRDITKIVPTIVYWGLMLAKAHGWTDREQFNPDW